MSKEEKSGGLFSALFTKKPPKGVTKQRGKSKDRYHEDPPEPLPCEYDSEEEIRTGHSHHDPKVSLNETKSKVKGLFKGPSDRSKTQQGDIDAHHPKLTKSNEKGGGRETPKKSTIESLFGSSDDGKSRKKKSQDRYHQKNPYEKYEKSESKRGKGGGGGGGGLFSGIGSSSGGGGTSGKTKVKSKGRSTSRQSKGGGSGGFSIPSF